MLSFIYSTLTLIDTLSGNRKDCVKLVNVRGTVRLNKGVLVVSNACIYETVVEVV